MPRNSSIKSKMARVKKEMKKGIMAELYRPPRLASFPDPSSNCYKLLVGEKTLGGDGDLEYYEVSGHRRDPLSVVKKTIGSIPVCIDYQRKTYYVIEPIYHTVYRLHYSSNSGDGATREAKGRLKLREILDMIGYVKRLLLLYAEEEFVELSGEKGGGEYFEKIIDRVKWILGELAKAKPSSLISLDYTRKLIEYYVLRDLVGVDVLEPLVNDRERIEDIIVPRPNTSVMVSGKFAEKRLLTNIKFSEEELNVLIEKIVLGEGKSVSLFSPLESLMIKRGHRVTVSYGREVSRHGPIMIIRMFSEPWSILRQFLYGGIQPLIAAYTGPLIAKKKSTLIVGVMGSGKTSMLNSLASFIPETSTIVTIEDTPEIMLPHKYWMSHITRPSLGIEKRGEIGMFDLVKHALRETADYVVIGEVRGEEGRIWAQAIATGHGGLTTLHADSPQAAIARLISPPINVEPSLLLSLYNIIMMQRREKQRYASHVYSVNIGRVEDPKTEVHKTVTMIIDTVLLDHQSFARETSIDKECRFSFDERGRIRGSSLGDRMAAKTSIRLVNNTSLSVYETITTASGGELVIAKPWYTPRNGWIPFCTSTGIRADVEDIVRDYSKTVKTIAFEASRMIKDCIGTKTCLEKHYALESIVESEGVQAALNTADKIAAYYVGLELLYLVAALARAVSHRCSRVLESQLDYSLSTGIIWLMGKGGIDVEDFAREMALAVTAPEGECGSRVMGVVEQVKTVILEHLRDFIDLS